EKVNAVKVRESNYIIGLRGDKTMALRTLSLAGLLLMLLARLPIGQTPPAAHTSARVALTFDDLPAHGPLPVGYTRVSIARGILAALRQRHAPPTYGFINAKDLDQHPDDAEVLKLWRDSGHPLGNHTFSHMDLQTNPAEAFEQDIIANEPTL